MLNVLIILAIIFLVVILSPILIPLALLVFAGVVIVCAFILDLITYPFKAAYKLIKKQKETSKS